MIERLVPSFVATAETRQDILDIELFAEEERSLGRAVEKRRREFITGRACARLALDRLGLPATPIPAGARGEPLWPPGVVGSITHCAGYRACAVARADEATSIGIDAEPNAALPDGVLEEVAFGSELQLVASDLPMRVDRLLFSAKEAVFKAWFPLTERWLGFEDAELSIEPQTRTFRARLLVPGPVIGAVELTELKGSWCLEDGVICTAVLV
ncbi:MAG TPA: 4'-phosphopantetheinyl transferase superfamily protein [Solirubrobacteraceae bacterium]|nr:4'-phosphopantetheinyl transferase superfamily protein [Solirubrobacteraceae bacterium]